MGYIGVGALYVHRTQGVPLAKREFLSGSLLPNKGFWIMFRGLVSDGLRFSTLKLRGQAAPAVGYSPVADSRRLGLGEVKQQNPEKEDRHRRGVGSTKSKRAKEKKPLKTLQEHQENVEMQEKNLTIVQRNRRRPENSQNKEMRADCTPAKRRSK